MLDHMAVGVNTAMFLPLFETEGGGVEDLRSSRYARAESLKHLVVDAFRRGGWRVVSEPEIAGIRPDLMVRRGNRHYVVELKSSAEGRRDRLIPLLAQAILQAKAAASRAQLSPRAEPLAVIGAESLPHSLIEELQSFAADVAPDVAIGIVDLHGSRIFVGRGLEELNHVVERPRQNHPLMRVGPPLHLFSDLNQWMLKVLLSPHVPDQLLHAPRQKIASASDLAKAADVSLMSASRLVSLLRAEGFLDESRDLELVNIETLLDRWRRAGRKPIREVPMRWIIPGNRERQLFDAVRSYLRQRESRAHRPGHALFHSRVCVGLFAAADALGFKFVRGVASHLYVERLDPLILDSLGLAPVRPGQHVDVFVRVPSFRESVFRPAVIRHEVPVCDVLQVWLDVADHPARGANQADEIWRHVLAPLWKRGPK
jgi:hypothetical protein